MISDKTYLQKQRKESEQSFLRQLDSGIDDMEAGRELPIKEAFQKIGELRKNRRDARL